jgi:DNA-directed RNA polymerase subunit N (RpoN/RPB10)
MFASGVIDLGCGRVVSSEYGVFKKNIKKKKRIIL